MADDLLDEAVRRHPRLTSLRNSMKVAVNEEFAGPKVALAEGDLVAILPPVAGG